MAAKQVIKEGYDQIAEAHADFWLDRSNFWNACIDQPAVLSLIGEVKGLKVLDLGCGPGRYSKILADMGAAVHGIDLSPKLVERAKKEFPEIDFQVADIESIPFPDQTFDLVVAPLVLQYVEDWAKTFSEVRRVLKAEGGKFIFSSTNPFMEVRERLEFDGQKWYVVGMDNRGGTIGDYLTERWLDYRMFEATIPFHHKTYQTIFRTIIKTGFLIEDYIDAKPTEESKDINPNGYQMFSKLPMSFAIKLRVS